MTRVLHIISDMNIGGAGRALINYVRACDRSRYDVSVAVPRGSLLKAQIDPLNVPVYEVDGMADRSFAWEDIRILKDLIAQVKPEIVHTHGALSGRIAARQMGCKVIYTRHCAFPVSAKLKYPPGRWVSGWINQHYADRIIAISPAAEEKLVESGVSPKWITTMMNGVTPVTPTTPEEQKAAKEAWGVKENAFVLGILARVEENKGHFDILEAMHLLRKEGRDVHFLVAGIGSAEETVRNRCRELGLEERVTFLGFVTDVRKMLSVLDLQLNASRDSETSSLAVLEGLSMGLPAVVSDCGGNPELVDDEQDGLIFPAGNHEALAGCIARLMDEPETLRRMSENARRIFNERFTDEIYAKNVEAVYETVMKG